jgi:hypothetical protein
VNDEWQELLLEAQRALSSLRYEQLEELAGRAECMLAATFGSEAVRQSIPVPGSSELRQIGQQQRLLGDLLLATKDNLAVLRRSRRDGLGMACEGEVDARWAR